MNWNGGTTTLSNNVSYRVLPSGSLPGTGLEPVPAQAGLLTGPSQILVALGIILALCGLALLIYGLWARQRRPLYAGRYTRNALVLLFIATLHWIERLAGPPRHLRVYPDGHAERSKTALSHLAGKSLPHPLPPH